MSAQAFNKLAEAFGEAAASAQKFTKAAAKLRHFRQRMDLPGTKSYAIRTAQQLKEQDPESGWRIVREPANCIVRKYYPRVGKWWWSVAPAPRKVRAWQQAEAEACCEALGW